MTALLSPHAAPFDFAGGNHGVLLIHGFTACPAQMRPLGQLLQEAGFSVKGIRLPGHGTSPEDMKKSTHEEWLNCALDAARNMRRQYEYFTVAGLSMGGTLSLICAAEVGPDACVTLAAPIKPTNKFAPYAGFLYPFYPTVHASLNPDRAYPYGEYDVGYASYPTKKVADLNKLIKLSKEKMPSVTCPLLSIQARGDKVIVPESLDKIQQNVQSTVKETLWLNSKAHVITLTPDLPLIAQTMIDFMKKAENK